MQWLRELIIYLFKMSDDEFVNNKIAEREPKDREQYQQLVDLFLDVVKDQKSTLPYIPAFHSYGKWESESAKIDQYLPRIYEARREQFCQSACEKEGASCFQQCRDFTAKAFQLGSSLFSAVHKPYQHSRFSNDDDEEE